MGRKKIFLLFLVLIFIFLWGRQLIPRKKNYKKMTEPLIEEKETIAGINIRKVEENISEIKKKISEFENNITLNEKFIISKNPLKPWITKKEPEKITKEEFVSIIKSEPQKPNFQISGIVYSDKKPYVIINNEVKEEGEKILDFIIQKIYPDKIILKDKDENFFTLDFNFEKGEKNER